MRLVNEQTRAKDLVLRWIRRFGKDSPQEKQILCKLPANPSADEVDKAFASFPTSMGRGNRVEREIQCDECGDFVPEAVEIGDYKEIDFDPYHRSNCLICAKCLMNADNLLEP